MPSVLITGANRGIGLEFSRQFVAEGWQVYASCRDRSTATELDALAGVEVHTLDVTDHEAIEALAKEINAPLDVVIANAGVMGDKGEAQNFGTLDYNMWRQVMEVNVYAAVKTCEAFADHVAKSALKKIAVISSRMGSIADTSGAYTAYRTSKTALNMAMVAAAPGLAETGVAVGIFHPGWVQTEMGGPNAQISTTECVKGLREQIMALSVTEQPEFLSYSGEVLPW